MNDNGRKTDDSASGQPGGIGRTPRGTHALKIRLSVWGYPLKHVMKIGFESCSKLCILLSVAVVSVVALFHCAGVVQ